jgi:hypothetical protein
MPWLKQLVAGLKQRRPGLAPRSVHVGFVEDKVELGRFFSEFFGFRPASHHPTTAPDSSITAP